MAAQIDRRNQAERSHHMSTSKFEILHEAFKQLAEDREQVRRQIALDLTDDGMFPIFWRMCSDFIDVGLKCATERDAGNILAVFTEEMPSAMHYATVDAKRTGTDVTATIALLDDMLEKALAAIGDDVYRDTNQDSRRSPDEVMARPDRSGFKT